MEKWSEFVEGRLAGVILRDQDNAVDIYISNRLRQKYTLTARGLKELRVWEMRHKNIIDRISLWDASSPETEYKERLAFLIYGAQEEKNKGAPESMAALAEAIESIRAGNAVLVEMEPVYGALILILAESVVISPEQ